MQSCMQKNEKKHEKCDCGSQVSLGVHIDIEWGKLPM